MASTCNEKKTLIGIYLDAFASADVVEKTLRHLADNTEKEYEILLLDDRASSAHCVNSPGKDAFPSLLLQKTAVIANEKVRGRPACFNRLIQQDARIYVFMDCGVLVTGNWLNRLLNGLNVSPSYGLAGPSSNNCWNEQGLFTDYDPAAIDPRQRAIALERKYHGQIETLEPLYSLAEFCFAVKKEIIRAVGPADENYGDGYCWEMDYNIRAARAGYSGIWVKAAYVQRTHFGGVQARNSSFLHNKQYYQDKFCGKRLRESFAVREGETGYCRHCYGDFCEHFAPPALIRLKPPPMPLVSCIMPTKRRSFYVAQAVKYFLEQDYPNRELIVVYDETTDLPANLPGNNSIRLLQVPTGSSIGFKRNKACGIARGEIIAHWDDDDWYAKDRLSRQVEPLIYGLGDITALYNTLFFVPSQMECWKCSETLYNQMFAEGVHGGTLVYKKYIRDKTAGYPDTSLREDADFLLDALHKGAKLYRIDGYRLFIYMRHKTNSWDFQVGRFLKPEEWERINDRPVDFEKDLSFYHSLTDSQTGATYTGQAVKQKNGRSPKVSCLMPTADRREFVPQAVENFLKQDYENKELIIIDDGKDKIGDLICQKKFPSIKYIPLDKKHTLGAKRNIACENAGGEVLIHFDDDDWMAPGWIRCQVSHLLETNADITGLDKAYFYSPGQKKAWQYIYPGNQKPWVLGGTLCYTKEFWGKRPFPEVNIAEDSEFVWSSVPKKIVPHDHVDLYVAMIHEKNTSAKYTSDSRWHVARIAKIKEIMREDFL